MYPKDDDAALARVAWNSQVRFRASIVQAVSYALWARMNGKSDTEYYESWSISNAREEDGDGPG